MHVQDCIVVNVGPTLVYAWDPPSTDISKGSVVEAQGECTGSKHVDALGNSISLVDVSIRQL